ncbi:hypothetical protein IQ260_22890 [Leptolyngbya cf. ectocarpi LEGE 11479]|uniref:Uncharacterized protein n=1 Tax=Leptolyngbya cf. ectocarpi LEGE 11479 TaxID=1828722 RepID=A0A928ZXU9_LEPEC|nr:hypothetical protein [Leptolyngbya ectocarpi]MBE9069497.1 hypothetical protein [Leptolyngbya cf. ectocarpi LEGE 11479]
MAKDPKPKVRRVSVDIGGIEKELEEFAELAGIPDDVWEQMPDSQKLLLLAKRGIQATREALAKDAEQYG